MAALKSAIFILVFMVAAKARAASFDGSLRSTTDIYQYHLGETTDDVVPYLQANLNGKHKFTKTWRTQWRLMALGNLESKGSPENFYADIPEAFIEKKFNFGLKLRGGMNTFNWGVVDVSAPSDTVNPSVLFHPLRTFKRGAPMLQAILGDEALSFEGIYIPYQQRPLLPSEDSRWLPRKFLLNIETIYGKIGIPPFLEYEFKDPETHDHAINNNYGGKLSSHIGSFDFQATYFRGLAPSPKLKPTITIDTLNGIEARSPVVLTPVHYLVETTGAGLVWAREKWIWRLESAYQNTITTDPAVSPWSWASVLAVETGIDVGSRTVTVLAQYYYTENPQAPDNLISSSYRLFDRTGVLGGRFAYSDELTFIATALYETKTRGLYWSAGFDHKWTDHLKWGLAWRDFSAERDGILKTYDRNDHATLDLTYYF